MTDREVTYICQKCEELGVKTWAELCKIGSKLKCNSVETLIVSLIALCYKKNGGAKNVK